MRIPLDFKTAILAFLAYSFLAPKKGSKPAPGTLNVPKAGAQMSLDELRQLAALVGFPDPNLAAAVAMAESGGYIAAVGDQGTSFGLWQIHQPAHPEYNAAQLQQATYNATAALAISKQGTDWSPWTTYKTGAYQRYMPSASTSGDAPALAAADVRSSLIEDVEHLHTEPNGVAGVAAEAAPEVLDQEPPEVLEDVEPGVHAAEVLEEEEREPNGTDARVRVVADDAPAAARTGRSRKARRG